MTKRPNIESYLKQNFNFLTLTEMAEDLDMDPKTIKNKLDDFGLKAITIGERTERYILENHKSKNADQIGKILGLCSTRLKIYYAKLGVSFNRAPKIIVARENNLISTASILSGYKLSGASHFIEKEIDVFDPIKNVFL